MVVGFGEGLEELATPFVLYPKPRAGHLTPFKPMVGRSVFQPLVQCGGSCLILMDGMKPSNATIARERVQEMCLPCYCSLRESGAVAWH